MNSLDIIALIVTVVAVASFSVVFTLLFGSYAKSAIAAYGDGKFDVEIISEYVEEGAAKKAERRQIKTVIKRIVGGIFLGIVSILLVIGIVNRITGNATAIGNRMLMVVASGSMSEKHKKNDYLGGYDNQFPTYSIIVLKKVDSPSELRRYDVIAYTDDNGKNIIHRVVRINEDGTYTTRGDANEASDTFHPSFENVIGKYTGRYMPVVGVFILFFQSYSGIATILAVIYCMIMFDNRIAAIGKKKEERTKALVDSLDLDKLDGEKEITVEFIEKLYLDKFVYHFDESGFVSKEVADELLKENPPQKEE